MCIFFTVYLKVYYFAYANWKAQYSIAGIFICLFCCYYSFHFISLFSVYGNLIHTHSIKSIRKPQKSICVQSLFLHHRENSKFFRLEQNALPFTSHQWKHSASILNHPKFRFQIHIQYAAIIWTVTVIWKSFQHIQFHQKKVSQPLFTPTPTLTLTPRKRIPPYVGYMLYDFKVYKIWYKQIYEVFSRFSI